MRSCITLFWKGISFCLCAKKITNNVQWHSVCSLSVVMVLVHVFWKDISYCYTCTGIRLKAMESSMLFCSLSVEMSVVFDMYIYYNIERLKIVSFEDVNAVWVVFCFNLYTCISKPKNWSTQDVNKYHGNCNWLF